MKQLLAALSIIGLLLTFISETGSAGTQVKPSRLCPLPWKGSASSGDDCQKKTLKLTTFSVLSGEFREINVAIRNGYLEENPSVPFRGNVIYYEGLGDSMLNHMPLFQELTNAGYRVIAFDYMGQGGSEGSMDDTRMLEISNLGNIIWSLHARDLAHFPNKNIIGWSTGGLAAYSQVTSDFELKNIVLIAPGIAPNSIVGEQHLLRGEIDLITLPTLTTQQYTSGRIKNPHVDPIKPNSPLKVPSFALDLKTAALCEESAPIPLDINGFVLLSGDKDTYVDAEKTRRIIKAQAPRFQIRQYPGALHEIDNEAAPNGPAARIDILNFLNSVN